MSVQWSAARQLCCPSLCTDNRLDWEPHLLGRLGLPRSTDVLGYAPDAPLDASMRIWRGGARLAGYSKQGSSQGRA